ncbi:ubiquinol-cytochrome-c reductase complex assembly factor 1, partial [Tachysurus ichikawai]
ATEQDLAKTLVSCHCNTGAVLNTRMQCRALHSTQEVHAVKHTPQTTEEEVGAFTKLIEAIGFTGPLKYNKWKIKIAALRMYTCCVERINYDEFFESLIHTYEETSCK